MSDECTIAPLSAADARVIDDNLVDESGFGTFQWFGFRDHGRYERRQRVDGWITDSTGLSGVYVGGEVIGFMGWVHASWGPSTTSWCWDVGTNLFPQWRGKGYGTQAQRQLVEMLFRDTTANRVQAYTAVNNLAERRSLEKAGFQQECHVRQAMWRDGRQHDVILYSVLRSETPWSQK